MIEHFFAPCPSGLEAPLAEDLQAAGARHVKSVPGGAQFSGDWETCYRANLESRIATRILWRVAEGPYQSEEDVYRLALKVDWPTYFVVDRTLRVYVNAVKSPLKSLEFVTLRVKDAICDRFRDACGRRPSVNTARPEVRIHLFLTATQATLYLDTSGEPLWLRGQKIAKVEAPVKENLAAGILRLIGWKPGIPLFDPMCGSGTFLIEAAQMSLGDAPGLARDPGEFGFERLSTFKPELWRKLCREAAQRRETAPATLPIWGADLSADAVARTRQNLDYAGIGDLVTVTQGDILTSLPPAGAASGIAGGILIANPPYGERLGEKEQLAAFYPRLGDALKRHYAGWNCWFFSADTALPRLIKLSVKRKIPLFNGPLECRVYHFPMVAGSNRETREAPPPPSRTRIFDSPPELD